MNPKFTIFKYFYFPVSIIDQTNSNIHRNKKARTRSAIDIPCQMIAIIFCVLDERASFGAGDPYSKGWTFFSEVFSVFLSL